ncbi:MAG: hypothetical protein EOP86_08705 [Verrucomicrobiaceae bacterium]|nr:MAG: hypothetical protein EOP86_08705 [Verrucomicrobiaceae bacterium]
MCFGWSYFNRANPRAKPSHVLTPEEQAVLDTAVPPKSRHPPHGTLGDYLKALAKLGGWLARARDGLRGKMVIWRRLENMMLSFKLAKIYG